MDIQYNVTMQRQSATHKAIVVSPAFVIMLLALSVFWLPPNCGEKIILNGIITLIVTVFLIYFAMQLPAMSGNTPLIGIRSSKITTRSPHNLDFFLSSDFLQHHPVPGGVRDDPVGDRAQNVPRQTYRGRSGGHQKPCGRMFGGSRRYQGCRWGRDLQATGLVSVGWARR